MLKNPMIELLRKVPEARYSRKRAIGGIHRSAALRKDLA
jgi:hypothetical protein